MKKQFTVVSSTMDLGDIYPIGTPLRVIHEQNNSYHAKALEVRSDEGFRIGFVANTTMAVDTSPGEELFDMMKAEKHLGGCPCVVKGYSEVGIGSGKQLIRKALIIEPVEI